jgi:hypothetical protein
MKTLKKLKILLAYYSINRGVGHTALLKEGTRNYDGDKFVLSHRKTDCQYLDVKPEEVISWENLDPLCGSKKPLIIDNAAIICILYETVAKLNELKEQNKKLREQKQLILVSPKDVLYKKMVELEEELERVKKEGKPEPQGAEELASKVCDEFQNVNLTKQGLVNLLHDFARQTDISKEKIIEVLVKNHRKQWDFTFSEERPQMVVHESDFEKIADEIINSK